VEEDEDEEKEEEEETRKRGKRRGKRGRIKDAVEVKVGREVGILSLMVVGCRLERRDYV